jgi:hypothetical protein
MPRSPTGREGTFRAAPIFFFAWSRLFVFSLSISLVLYEEIRCEREKQILIKSIFTFAFQEAFLPDSLPTSLSQLSTFEDTRLHEAGFAEGKLKERR